MVEDIYREWNRSNDQIRTHGAVGNLNRGLEIIAHGVNTRLIAWPGNGFQTESVHVVTIKPGEETEVYTYAVAEEALLCVWGEGEVFLRGEWISVAPGDLVYVPSAIPHGLRNRRSNSGDFILVTQTCPPQFDLYEAASFYNREHGVMNFDVINEAKKDTRWAGLTASTEVRMRDTHPSLRPWNLSVDDIRRDGALFNVFKGSQFGGLGTPMLLILWPGYGVRSTGLHMGGTPAGKRAEIHTHPVADECLFNWQGTGQAYCDGMWMPTEPLDCLLAPCGVHHSIGGPVDLSAGPSYGCGFASPPQLDLYLNTPFYHNGTYDSPPWAELSKS
jgi:gentisate 1,2-dioxygenase